MARTESFTCVSCPLGCMLEVSFDDADNLVDVTGNSCNRGIEYAKQEAVDPQRNISAVVMAEGSLEPLSVKTARPIPKAKIFDVMEQVRALRPCVPIEEGQVLIEDAAETGVPIVATKTLR